MNKLRDYSNMLKEVGFSLLEEGKTLKIRADGYSMYPVIKPGSVIIIERPEGKDPYHPGDIIAWKRDQGLVVHRIVQKNMYNDEVRFITRGDSCKYEDKAISPDQVAGKVTLIETAAGRKKIPVNKLTGKPAYLYNRFAAWSVSGMKKVFSVLTGN